MTEYQLPIPELPEDVKVTTPLLGCIEELKYVDHNLNNTTKFSRFQPDNYQNVVTHEGGGEAISPVDWVVPLYRSTILNATILPHFRHSPEVNDVV